MLMLLTDDDKDDENVCEMVVCARNECNQKMNVIATGNIAVSLIALFWI